MKMTIKELYNWAKENNVQNNEILLRYLTGDRYFDIDDSTIQTRCFKRDGDYLIYNLNDQ